MSIIYCIASGRWKWNELPKSRTDPFFEMRSAGFELVSRSCTRFLGRFFGFNAKRMSLASHVPGKARANRLREDEPWSSDTVSYASNRLYGVGSANPAT